MKTAPLPFFITAGMVICLSFTLCSTKHSKPAGSYESLKQRVIQTRDSLSKLYQGGNVKQKEQIVKEAKKYLLHTISDDLIPYWYDTPWEFYGTTEVPGKGSIACGYFVTTVIRDAGFMIPRIAWAQLPSESMMKKLNPKLKRFINAPIDSVVSHFKTAAEGLYLVGLDNHVGFVLKTGDEVKFIHSSYYYPDIGVMKEDLKGRNPLNDSKYRVFARLLHDEMVISWLLKKQYK